MAERPVIALINREDRVNWAHSNLHEWSTAYNPEMFVRGFSAGSERGTILKALNNTSLCRNAMRLSKMSSLVCACALVTFAIADDVAADGQDSVQLIGHAVSAKPGSGVEEISTEELKQVLRDRSAVVLDTRCEKLTSKRGASGKGCWGSFCCEE